MTRTEAVLLAAALAACATRDGPGPPRPLAVNPAAGLSSEETIVEISGEGFEPDAVQRSDSGGSRVDATFRAWLDETELDDVLWIDGRTLRARVPAGLPAGSHDLVVEGPTGRGALARAYLVVDGLPASLGVALAAPARATVGDEVQLAVTAENTGTSPVTGVVPTITTTGGGALEPVAGVAAVPQDLQPGAVHEFVLRFVASRAGAVSATVSLDGVDPRIGGPVSVSTTRALVVRPPPSVTVLATDPFLDGSAFAFVAQYGGAVVLGPNRSGTGLVRMDPDGAAAESFALSFARDQIGNQSSNAAYPCVSIGFTGCAPNRFASACGPDNEDGRGFMTSVTYAGDEWLVLGGARSPGSLEYVYMSRGSTSPLPFSYVDLSAALGGNTRGFSAARVAGGRLYLGFPDNGGARPYGLALLAAPPALAGLDAVLGPQVVDVKLHDAFNDAYGDRFRTITMVDAFADLGGRLYAFADTGCLVATSLAPLSKSDWTGCSPVDGPAYALAEAVPPPRQFDLGPRDHAWPAVVVHKGRLFALRNTTTGPQLWRCDPAGGVDPVACDRGDWTLVAADASYRTSFGKPGASAASLLLSTGTQLYVGLDDDAAGIHLFRSAADVPAGLSDFVGRDGCIAGSTGCEGIGGDGLGAPDALRRIFDAKVIEWSGGTDLVLTAGDGSGPVRVVRVAP
jgi:hypothetical protein